MSAKATTETDRIVGARINGLRKAKGLSQTALGQALGVTFQQVQKYEKGQNRVSGSRLQQVAQVLGVPVSTLFGEDELTGQDKTPKFRRVSGDREILQAYAEIESDELRRAVLHVVRAAAKLAIA